MLQAVLLPRARIRRDKRFKSDMPKGVISNGVNSGPPEAIRKIPDKYIYTYKYILHIYSYHKRHTIP